MLKRLALVSFSMAAFAGLAVAAEALSIKEVMGKLNKGPNAALAKLKSELKAETPDWGKITATSSEIVKLTEDLAAGKPKKGDASSWEKFAGAYLGDAKALETAAKDHNLKAAKSAAGKLGAACKSCHTAHK